MSKISRADGRRRPIVAVVADLMRSGLDPVPSAGFDRACTQPSGRDPERGVDRINFHHLFYFWIVAREGGLAPAGRVLKVSHPTLSAQIHTLEEQLGAPLFSREGRRLVLTDTGQVVLRYADEIFALGRELQDAVQGRRTDQPMRLVVGVIDSVPKLVARQLLEPALRLDQPVRLVCREGGFQQMLAELANHAVDLIISDAPVPPGSPVRAFGHLLGETGVSLVANEALVRNYASGYPASLQGAPLLLPADGLPLRRAIDHWLQRHGLRPTVVAEFEDSALMKVFGADGVGIFPVPTVVERQACEEFSVRPLGRMPEVHERFYAISSERRLSHPAVVAICDVARQKLFAVRAPETPAGG